MPFAVSLIAVSGGMLTALAATLGSAIGYLYFWGFTGGLEFLAVGMLVFASVCIFREFDLAATEWFMPVLTAVMAAVVGFLFLLQARFSPLRVCMFFIRTALAAGTAAAFRRAERLHTPGATLYSLACFLVGLSAVELSGGVTLGHIAGTAVSAAAACSPVGPAVAAACGLAMDIRIQPQTSFCAVLSLASLVCRLVNLRQRTLRMLLFLLCCAGAVLASGGQIPEFVPAAAAGCCLSLLIPERLFRSRASTESSGGAQAYLEKAAGTLSELQTMLEQARPAPGCNSEAAEVFDRASERVCRCCVLWNQCWQQKSLDTYHALCAVARPMMERGSVCREDFPKGFSENCRHLDGLVNAVNRELDGQLCRRQLNNRLREGRAVLSGQYAVLSRYLRDTARHLTPRTPPGTAYTPELGVRGTGKKGCAISGDRGACFRTEDGLFYVLLCDGMGTGPEAAAEASAAVRTLTNLLQAGMAPAGALETLNGHYILRDDGGFSTVDLLQVSLITGEAVLYKWGAAPSYLHQDKTTKKVGAAAPPPGLGVGGTHKAEEIRLSLQRGELLVLISDGAGGEETERRISSCGDMAPKELAAAIVAGTEAEGEDDMTAVVIRLRPCSAHG